MKPGHDLSLASASPEYAAILAKIVELDARRVELIAVAREPGLTIHDPRMLPVRDSRALDPYRQTAEAASPNSDLAALIGDVAPLAKAEGDHEVLARLGRELAKIDRALAVLHEKLRDTRLAASAAICDRIRPEYQKRATAVANAAAALSEALGPYDELASGLRREGVAWAQLGALSGVDELLREVNPLGKILKSAAEGGHIAGFRASRAA